MKVFLTLFLISILCIQGCATKISQRNLAAAQANPEEELANWLNELNSTVTLENGYSLTKFTSPGELYAFMESFNQWTQKIPKDMSNDIRIQSFYLIGLSILYYGRGPNGAETGWHVGMPGGDTAIPYIKKILDWRVLDKDGVNRLENFMSKYNFRADKERRSAGFEYSHRTYGSNTQELEVIQGHLKKAPVTSFVYVNKNLSFSEIVSNVGYNEEQIRSLNSMIETNLFARAVNDRANGNQKKFYGREKELRAIYEALQRMEKGHVLLTGKAGVGKTTILKMLQQSFLNGVWKLGESSPMIFELSVLSVATNDPSKIKEIITAFKALARKTNRHIILYVDEAHIASKMTLNSIKAFLTESTSEQKLHFIWATTSDESKQILGDVAFARRWVAVEAQEFSKEQTIALLKLSYLPEWRKHHNLESIDDDAYEFAAKYFKFEQPHAGNPTGMREFLEGAIITKKMDLAIAGDHAPFTLHIDDLRHYVKNIANLKLVPGDEHFIEIFETMWSKFEQDYTGNEGLKYYLKQEMLNYFSSLSSQSMKAFAFFGAPGAGKTFGAKELAKHFFNGSLLSINGAELDGQMGVTKLIGSTSGFVGSEEQRSILTKFVKENPNGGVILVEEADYIGGQVEKLFVNMITDGKIQDGLGKTYDMSKYVLIFNSNFGQEYMISMDAKNKMDWNQFQMKKKSLVDLITVEGREIEVPKDSIMATIMERFVGKVMNGGKVDSSVRQEAAKMSRRVKGFYVMSPTLEDLQFGIMAQVSRFKAEMKLEYGLEVDIPDDLVGKIADLEHYEFEKGFTYGEKKLESGLFSKIRSNAGVLKGEVRVSLIEVQGQNKILLSDGSKNLSFGLEEKSMASNNVWANNPQMVNKIKNFAQLMDTNLKGNEEQIIQTKEMLKRKLIKWDTRLVLTQIGTSGNGKTEFFKSLTKALYGSEHDMFEIKNLNHPGDLQNYLRPSKGHQGGDEQTQFEKWLLSRINSGGGTILFDEILSISGLTQEDLGKKVAVINMLYDMLDNGFVEIQGERHDISAFTIGLTGNAMQEYFNGIPDTPEAEVRVAKQLKAIGINEITKYFEQHGIDAPKVARFGKIFVNGPLPRAVVVDISKLVVKNFLQEFVVNRPQLTMNIDQVIIENISKKLTTVKLGMREVKKGIEDLILASISGILVDIVDVKSIEAKEVEGRVVWLANGQEVSFTGVKVGSGNLEERSWNYKKDQVAGAIDRTPQYDVLRTPVFAKVTPQELKWTISHELYGHWAANALLSGKNLYMSMSVKPGDGYLGYVAHKLNDFYESQTLSSLLREIIVLEAGSKATFWKDGISSSGGGGSGKELKDRNDDYGKVERNLNTIIVQQLVPGINEFDQPQKISVVKNLLRNTLKLATDKVVQQAINSKVFDQLALELEKTGYLNEDALDDYIGKINWSNAGLNNEQLLFKSISEALPLALNELSKAEFKLINGEVFAKELMARLSIELKSLSGQEDVAKALIKMEKDAFSKISAVPLQRQVPGNTNCHAVVEKLAP